MNIYCIIAFYTILILGRLWIPKIVEGTMGTSEVVTIVVSIISLIGVIAAANITQNAKIKKISEKLEQISSDLGVGKNRACLSQQHEDLKSDIVKRIGSTDKKGSLTHQNTELLKAVNFYKEEKENRIKKFSKQQKDIQKTIDSVLDFFEDWKRTNSELNNANERAKKFEEETEFQKSEVEKLEKQNAELSASNADLRHQNAELNDKIEKLIIELKQEKEVQKNKTAKDNREIQNDNAKAKSEPQVERRNIPMEAEESETEQDEEFEPEM